MAEGIRTARTLGVTSSLSPQQRGALATIRTHDGYSALLDVMEQTCIEQESRLINCDVTDSEAVLAEHRKTQAMWQMFTHMQQKVDQEVRLHAEYLLPDPTVYLSEQQMEDEELLNPTLQLRRPHPGS